MSVKKFRGRVDHHVGAELDGTLKIWRHESIVDDDLNAVPVAQFADGAKVAKLHQRIGRRLQKQQPRVLLECALNLAEVGCIDIGKCKAKVDEDLIEQARRPAIEIVAGNNVVAGFEHGSNGVDRRHSAAEDARCRPAFERGKVRLQPVASGIRYARVFVAFVFSDFFLNVSGSRIDGRADRTGKGIGLLSSMDGAGCEAR